MIINTFSVGSKIEQEFLQNKTVIVLDILRATTNIVYAFAHGCRAFIPLETVQEAKNWAHELGKESFLLGGERNRIKIEGFHLSNSPKEYQQDIVKGKIILFTTTNGTKAIKQAALAKNILVGSFLNLAATANLAWEKGEDIVLLCAGTKGFFSLEDTLAAGMIIDFLVKQDSNIYLDDLSLAARNLYYFHKNNLQEALSLAENGKELIKLGLAEDIRAAAKTNIYDFVPFARNGIIKLHLS